MPMSLHLLLLLFLFAAIGNSSAERVHCPDGRSFCPDGTTCCQLIDKGHFGCCPLPNAICCNDHLHCCPENSQCDLPHQTCTQSDGNSQPLHRKIPAKTQSEERIQQKEKDEEVREREGTIYCLSKSTTFFPLWVICPDGSSKCPPRSTCCPLSDGFRRRRKEFWRLEMNSGQSTLYGCCPTDQAVCCADHVHCCPHGTQCDTKGGECVGTKEVLRSAPMKKVRATKVTHLKSAQETEASVHICGDSVRAKSAHRHRMSICQSNEKCCHHAEEEEKRTSCCPFVDGQCCAHSAHCCPVGFACARDEERCVSEQNGISLSTQMFPTRSAIKKRFYGLKMPTECADGTFCGSSTDICCPRSVSAIDGDETTTFSCCPLSKGICCEGSEKCCPMGYRCSTEGKGCERMDVREQIVRLFMDKK